MNYDRSSGELWQYFINHVQQNGNEYLLWLFGVGFATFLIFSIYKKQRPNVIFYFSLALIPCALAGAFSKVITFAQYYFATVPFVLLLLAITIRDFPKKVVIFSSLFVAVFFCFLLSKFWRFDNLKEPSNWRPLGTYKEGEILKSFIENQKVLTLSPLYVLEGGGQIYPAFANGPFAWRTSHLIEKKRRAEIVIVGSEDLDNYLADDFPDAILTGFEGRHDEKIKTFARENDFVPLRYHHQKKREIWLPRRRVKVKTIAQKLDTTTQDLTTAYSQSIHELIGNRANSKQPVIFQATIQIKSEQAIESQRLHLVLDIRRNGKSLFWRGELLDSKNLVVGKWQTLDSPAHLFNSAELKASDELVVFLWNPQKVELELRNLQLEEIEVIF
ncbi:MAG: hypothetical protein AAGG68_25665 [Bacteroidota bacterium]